MTGRSSDLMGMVWVPRFVNPIFPWQFSAKMSEYSANRFSTLERSSGDKLVWSILYLTVGGGGKEVVSEIGGEWWEGWEFLALGAVGWGAVWPDRYRG